MIELVIPTLWKSEKIHKMLPKYIENPNISSIHIIDNGQQFGQIYGQRFSPKLRIYTPPIYNEWYVNQAWNLGVSNCSANSIVGILNDDIEFNTDIFEWIVLNSEDMGILGMHDTNYKLQQDTEYKIIDIPQHNFGWGCMFFLEKRDWSIIPPQLKIYFGDTWQFHSNEVPCKALTGLSMINSNVSATTASPETFQEFNELYIQERDWFYQNVQQKVLNLK